MTTRDTLNSRQQRFVDAIVLGKSGTQAAITAGYSERGADVTAARLLVNVKVAAVLAERQAAITEKVQITAEWVTGRAIEIVQRCMQAEPVTDRRGEPIEGEWQFDATGANGALKLLALRFPEFSQKHEVKSINLNIDVAMGKDIDDRDAS